MPGFDVGTIQGTLDLDRDPFQATWDQIVDEVHEFVDEPHTITIDLDDGAADAGLDELQANADETTGRDYVLTVTVDDAEAEAALAELDGQTAGARALTLTLDDAQAEASLEELQASLDQATAPHAVRVTLDDAEAQSSLEALNASLEQSESDPHVVPVTLNDAQAIAAVGALNGLIEELNAQRAEVLVGVVDEEALARLRILSEEIEQLEAQRATVVLEVDGARAEAGLEILQADVDQVTGRTHTLRVVLDDTEAVTGLAALEAEADGLSTRLSDLQGSSNEAQVGLDDLDIAATGMAEGVDAAGASLSRLGTGLDEAADGTDELRISTDDMIATVQQAGFGLGALDDMIEHYGLVIDDTGTSQANFTEALQQWVIAADEASTGSVVLNAGLGDVMATASDQPEVWQDTTAGINNARDAMTYASQAAVDLAQPLQQVSVNAGESEVALNAAADEARRFWANLANMGPAVFASGLDELNEGLAGTSGEMSLTVAGTQDVVSALSDMQIVTVGARGGLYDMSGASTTLNRVLAQMGLNLETLVGKTWPEFYASLDEGQQKLLKTASAAGGAGNGIRDLDRAAADASGSEGGLGLLATTLLTLGPALVDISGVGLGAVLSLGGAFLTVATGLGAFALAAESDLGTVEGAVKKSFSAWQTGLQGDVMPVIQEIPGVVSSFLRDIDPLVAGASAGLDQVGKSLKADLDSTALKQFIDWLGGQAPTALMTFNETIQNWGSAFSKMGEVASPVINEIEEGMVDLGHDLTKFATSPTFHSFIDWLLAEGPQVRTFFDDLGGDLGKLLSAAAPVGHVTLDVVDGLLSLLHVALELGGPLDSVALGAIAGGVALSKLGGMAESAVGWLVKLGGTTGIIDSATVASVGAKSGIAGLGASVVALAPELGFGALALGAFAGTLYAVHENAVQMAAGIDAITHSVELMPTKTLTEEAAAITATRAKIAKLSETTLVLRNANNELNDSQPFRGGNSSLSGVQDQSKAIVELKGYLKQLTDEQTNWYNNLVLLYNQFGLNTHAAEQMAHTLGITLSKALTPQQVQEFSNSLDKAATQAGTTSAALAALASRTGQSVSQLSSDISNAASTTKTAFTTATEVLAHFQGQATVTGEAVAKFYATTVSSAQGFANNIQVALKDGYNPQLIAQLLEAGPAQAGPLLSAMVHTASSSFVNMVNASQAALGKITQEGVEEAKLMQVAVASSNAQTTDDYSAAVAIWGQIVANGGHTTVQALASALQIGVATVQRILTEYGAVFGNSVTTATSKGKKTGAAYAAGIRSAGPEVINATTALTGPITTAFAQSRNPTGAKAGATFAAGLSSSAASVQDAADKVSALVPPAFDVTARGAGQSVAQGFASGMFSWMPQVDAAAGALARSAVTAAKSAVTAHSPSRLSWDEVGVPIGQGVEGGMLSTLGGIEGAAERMALAGIPTVPRTSLNTYGSMIAQSEIAGIGTSPAGAGITVQITHAEHIQGGADPQTVAQWKSLLAQHDTTFINLLDALQPTP